MRCQNRGVNLRRVLGRPGWRTTVRRAGFLLLGGAILLPYVLLVWTFGTLLADDRTPVAPVVVLAGVMVVIGAVPALLPTTRVVEIAAVRTLLDADVPDPPSPVRGDRRTAIAWETRTRTAVWYLVHLLVGGVVTSAVVVSVLVALSPLVALPSSAPEWITSTARWILVVTGVAGLVICGYAMSVLGAVLGRLAPRLLGPSAAERVVGLELRARELAERNQLARELHASVGHSLSVATLQAAAAGTLLERDPVEARRALVAIEDAGRRAITELDHVLAVLHTGETRGRFAPQGTLLDLAVSRSPCHWTRATGCCASRSGTAWPVAATAWPIRSYGSVGGWPRSVSGFNCWTDGSRRDSSATRGGSRSSCRTPRGPLRTEDSASGRRAAEPGLSYDPSCVR
jgi:hypothetical protein